MCEMAVAPDYKVLSLQHIKENLLIPDSGFPRTPPKLEGLGR